MEYRAHESDFSRPRDTGGKSFGYSSQNEEYAKPQKYLKGDSLAMSSMTNPATGSFRQEGFVEANNYLDSIGARGQKTHNKENIIAQAKKSRVYQPSYDVSMEEGVILLQLWEQNHFIDFNSWLQSAKARVVVSYPA